MKPETAGPGMNSTIQPSLSKPMPRTMKPQMKARQTAICGPVYKSDCSCTWWMTLETSSDMTATGPIETSLLVAKTA